MRRPRYKGKYPRHFQEKYKELNPELYSEEIEKIKNSGRTPVGTHTSIMVREVLVALAPNEGNIILDLTLGYGGHCQEFCARLKEGRVIAFDQDAIELEKTKMRLSSQFPNLNLSFVTGNFRKLSQELAVLGMGLGAVKVDVVFADLGLSSMQIDKPERGFNLNVDMPLDLRMDTSKGLPAYALLADLSVEKLQKILIDFCDEPFAYRMAKSILEVQKGPKTGVLTTFGLKRVVGQTVAQIRNYPQDPQRATRRILQALRIWVNEELDSLKDLLDQLPNVLNRGARVGFLTFHSGEDRLVKKFFQQSGLWSQVGGPVQPTGTEIQFNRRARPAKFRWGIYSGQL